MEALVIADKEYQGQTYQGLKELIDAFLQDKGFETKLTEVGTDNLTFCKGCFGCWIKKPGECVINDLMGQINRDFMNSDLVIYLSPVVFGQCSANIKNSIDRNVMSLMLPFFETRPDGSTMHPPRYDSLPRLIIIGYGDGIPAEDQQLFLDITKKHRRNVEVFIYQNRADELRENLAKMKLERVDNKL